MLSASSSSTDSGVASRGRVSSCWCIHIQGDVCSCCRNDFFGLHFCRTYQHRQMQPKVRQVQEPATFLLANSCSLLHSRPVELVQSRDGKHQDLNLPRIRMTMNKAFAPALLPGPDDARPRIRSASRLSAEDVLGFAAFRGPSEVSSQHGCLEWKSLKGYSLSMPRNRQVLRSRSQF